MWWAHLDSNQGPKDYEQLKEIKVVINQLVITKKQNRGSKRGSTYQYFNIS